MAISWQPTAYPIFGGVDSKVDGFVLPAPKLQVAENVYSDRTGSLQRRYGRTGITQSTLSGSTVTDWAGLAKHKGSLLGLGQSNVYSYSSSATAWASRGQFNSWRVKANPIAADDANSVIGACMDMAVMDGYRCYVYDSYTTSGANVVTTMRVTLTDDQGAPITTGLLQQTVTAGAASSSACKVVAFNGAFYVCFVDMSTTTNLKCTVIDMTSTTTIQAFIDGTATTGTISGAFDTFFDVCVDNTYGPFLVHKTTTANQIRYGHVTTAGALTDAATAATSAAVINIGCDVFGTAKSGIAYSTAAPQVRCILLSWSGAAWTVTSTSGSIDAGITIASPTVACKWDSTTVFRMWYSDTLTSYTCLVQSTYTTGGVTTARTNVLPRSILAAKPFTVTADSTTYTWVLSEPGLSGTQPTLYCMSRTGTLAAWANQGVAVYPLFGVSFGLCKVTGTSANEFTFICPHLTGITTTASGTLAEGSIGAIGEVSVATVHSQSHTSVEDGECTYIPGGFLQQYDGVSTTEVGFLAFTDTANRATITPGGAGAVHYGFRIIPEWTNAQGEREYGTDNGPYTVTTAIADDSFTITVDCIPWTLKNGSGRANLVWGIYCTLRDPTADSPHYRIGSIENDVTKDRVSVSLSVSDVDKATKPTLFLDSGELDPIAPPAGYIVAAGNGRVFLAGFADDPCLVRYSKQRSHGEALSFSDALTIQVPQSTGDITALSVMNEALYVFTERSIYRVRGAGPNNLGVGGFSDPEVVTTEDGALGPRAVVLAPDGIMFEYARGGIGIVAQGGQLEYIGQPLEKLTAGFRDSSAVGNYTGAVVIPGAQHVRFTTATTTHVYDYHHRQWYVWTDHSDGPCVEWNGAHAGIRAQAVTYDNIAAFTDNFLPYSVTVQLGWYHPGIMQGNMAVRRIGIMGDATGQSYLRVTVGYDYQADSQAILETITARELQVQYPTTTQKCSAVQLTIRDAALDAYGADVVFNTAGWKLNEVEFEVGFRRGAMRRRGVSGTVTDI